jgi:hypothetical protein
MFTKYVLFVLSVARNPVPFGRAVKCPVAIVFSDLTGLGG